MKQEREGGQDRAGISKVAYMSAGAKRRHVLKVASLVMIGSLSPYLYDSFVTTREAFMFRFSIHINIYIYMVISESLYTCFVV